MKLLTAFEMGSLDEGSLPGLTSSEPSRLRSWPIPLIPGIFN